MQNNQSTELPSQAIDYKDEDAAVSAEQELCFEAQQACSGPGSLFQPAITLWSMIFNSLAP